MGDTFKMRIASIKDMSLVDGEGTRLVIFTTGCIHNCPGCHNKDFQNYNYSEAIDMTTEQIIDYIKERKEWIDGITLSGGDPLFQLNATKELIHTIRKDKVLKDLNIWLFTGYLFKDIPQTIKNNVDVIIDGPFIKEMLNKDYQGLPIVNWRGSLNQVLYRKNSEGFWDQE